VTPAELADIAGWDTIALLFLIAALLLALIIGPAVAWQHLARRTVP
jgi:hypothetical protein